ncbi:MAG: hypothetical protein PWQ10_210 [Patescibacteria group bacterium]|nr:hypothetical protein [Patescibacteria group bacterium]
MPRRNKSIKYTQPITPTCSPKRQFANEKLANDAAEYQMLIKNELELRTYKCNLCNKWHLTRSKKQLD